ncbi:universal stress protein [Robertmurraya andreesenii]|uniref:Nucleotide-binding universal stress UspA family protein n=1 Tax=Anoxybacillus andreesenii TaxID=1325932 RepID=A0ABT9V5P7_9BACL|nr:universal stress protein [Robertmurraya andreesenii]MDQ0156269.1 nucleotide-binding universal stress UspA family protein [Robertmurraya andreesenii]
MSKKIIVPIDGSKTSQNALSFAISMAKAYGDQIRLINIQPNHQILGESVIAEAARLLEEARVLYSSKIRLGTPSIEIITEAKDADIRCIVMGTKGAGNSDRKLGSVSQATLTMAPCPIVFIPS